MKEPSDRSGNSSWKLANFLRAAVLGSNYSHHKSNSLEVPKVLVASILTLLLIFVLSIPVFAQGNRAKSNNESNTSGTAPSLTEESNSELDPSLNTDANGLAVQGYDVVAYFPSPIGQGMPVEGNPEITAQHQGATYYFANEANRDRFIENPDQFAPQYGGYCAWAVSQGSSARIIPEAFTVHNGRLFLNFSRGVQRRFDADLGKNIQRADANWPSVKASLTKSN